MAEESREWNVTLRRIIVQEYTLNGVVAGTQEEAIAEARRAPVMESEWRNGTTTDVVVTVRARAST